MSIWVFLPTLAFFSGMIASIYLLIEWYKHKEHLKFPLLWAIALFLMYWLQVPVILTNSGRVVTATDFNFFFAIMLPIFWIALFLLYAGSLSVLGFKLKPRGKVFVIVWFIAAVIFFGYHFVIKKGIISNYSLPIVSNMVFYIPLHLLIIFAFLRKLLEPTTRKTMNLVLGSLAIMGASTLGIARNFIIIKKVLMYSPELWYIVLVSQKMFFALQTISIVLIAIGFFFLHNWYCKLNSAKLVC